VFSGKRDGLFVFSLYAGTTGPDGARYDWKFWILKQGRLRQLCGVFAFRQAFAKHFRYRDERIFVDSVSLRE
jgi:hypothetical protein